MFCVRCGKQLPDDARFCSACGTPMMVKQAEPKASVSTPPVVEQPKVVKEEPVVAKAEPVQAAEVVNEAPMDSQEPAEAPKKKKKRLGLILGIAAAAVAVVAIVAVVLMFVFGGSGSYVQPSVIGAYVSDDGTAYLCYADGQCVEIGNDIESAQMTPDQKYIVVKTEEGNLYVTDAKLSNKVDLETVDSKTEYLTYQCCNKGVFYSKTNDKTGKITACFYNFDSKNGSAVEIVNAKATELRSVTMFAGEYSYDSFALAYATDGSIYTYVGGDDAATTVASYNKDQAIQLKGISADGKTVVWMQAETDGSVTVKLYADEEISTVTTFDKGEEPSAYISFSADGALWIMSCGDTMYYRQGDGDVQKVSLPEEMSGNVYTSNGFNLLADTKAAKATGLFVCADSTIYYVNLADASREKLVSDVQYGWFVLGDTLYYQNEDDVAYAATVDFKKATLGDKVKVASDVYNVFYAQGQADYVYYLKEVDTEADISEGDLFVYDVKKGESTRVASDVYTSVKVSTDGKTVYFFEDTTEATADGNYLATYGTLKSYSVKDEETTKIADDVITSSVTSHYTTGELDATSMWFKVYEKAKKDTYQYTISYYNGEKKTDKVVEMVD